MDFAIWSIIVGVLLVVMALGSTVLARLPLSTAMLYLLVGIGVSPLGMGLLWADPMDHSGILERLTEVAVLVSLFSVGLKLSPNPLDRRWRLPLRLATVSMIVTVGLITAAGYYLLALPIGGAVLLGGILAPTDPVLASDVQVHAAGDRDRLRFALTGEGGMNDGTAFPFVILGLVLLGLHDAGSSAWHWIAVDVVWGVVCGLVVGALSGLAVGRLVLYLRREHKEAVGLDAFLALGLIALSYGVALVAQGYGFLAVFAAGVALRQLEQRETTAAADSQKAVEKAQLAKVKPVAAAPGQSLADAVAVHPQHAPAFMAQAVLGFNQELERIGEVAVVIAIGALLWAVKWEHAVWWFVPMLLLVIRPLSVAVGLIGSGNATTGLQRRLIGWFGIRGIGSLYYLMYAINHGLPAHVADPLVALTLSVVVSSIVVHGISVTPLMAVYERSARKRGGRGR